MSDVGRALDRKTVETRKTSEGTESLFAFRVRRRVRRIGYCLARPFRVRVYWFEQARVEVRTFPPRFEWSWNESLREQMARGGLVVAGAGTHFISKTITVLPGTTLTGATISGPLRDGDAILRLPVDDGHA